MSERGCEACGASWADCLRSQGDAGRSHAPCCAACRHPSDFEAVGELRGVDLFVRTLRRSIDPDDGPAVASVLSRTAAALWMGGGGNGADFMAMTTHHARVEMEARERRRREYWLEHAADLQRRAAASFAFYVQLGRLPNIGHQEETARMYAAARVAYAEVTE